MVELYSTPPYVYMAKRLINYVQEQLHLEAALATIHEAVVYIMADLPSEICC
jgi:hypothetical protein